MTAGEAGSGRVTYRPSSRSPSTFQLNEKKIYALVQEGPHSGHPCHRQVAVPKQLVTNDWLIETARRHCPTGW
ncbi:MAG: hypothetical protein IPH26_22965 [Sterolibacteriaceae bacterium]|uniref:Uncharacterized protein n=1 Tax=Candidatus Methylophosphatis roskildensis TaxID=2899263 RepID=A0A9D7EDQ2_9PROT|nr:hypothetical protein [Candidatus Methylophosphatis roskildensis]